MVTEIIDQYYPKGRKVRDLLLTHSKLVRDKALDIVSRHPELMANEQLLSDGAMLHDIGIIATNAPDIDCHGTAPYIRHCVIGRKILEKSGAHHLAMFAEHHTGAGLSLHDIESGNLPLPRRDMLPTTIEEEILCFADKFYSKGKHPEKEKSLLQIREKLSQFGPQQLDRFNQWCEKFL